MRDFGLSFERVNRRVNLASFGGKRRTNCINRSNLRYIKLRFVDSMTTGGSKSGFVVSEDTLVVGIIVVLEVAWNSVEAFGRGRNELPSLHPCFDDFGCLLF
jgi:hypothetical protein